MENLYERDFYSWSQLQAQLVREGRFSELDLENLIEEIEDMGNRYRDKLESHLKLLLMHLLKWQYQPERRGVSWELSIKNHRDEVEDTLEKHPGLKSKLESMYPQAYLKAVRVAARETGNPIDIFPGNCPWPFEAVMEDEFLPE